MVPETYAWNDYWQKLATQAAGKNLPDLIQMDYRFIFEYARRQQLAALDEFIGKQLRARGLRPEPARLGQGRRQALRRLDGRQLDDATSTTRRCSASSGSSCPTRRPGPTTTSRRSACRSRTSCPRACISSRTMGYWEPRLENWVRQRGKALYTEDGQLGYELAGPDRLLRLLEGDAGQGPDPAGRHPEPGRRRQDGKLDVRDGQVALRRHPLEPARRQPEADAGRDQHHDGAEPDGRPAGAVPEALDAAVDGGDLGATRRRRPS